MSQKNKSRIIQVFNRPCPLCESKRHEEVTHGSDFEYNACKNEFYVVKCLNCGILFLNPAPIKAEISYTYPASYTPHNLNIESISFSQYIRDLRETRKASIYRNFAQENSKVFEVGCGDGRYLSL